MKKKILSLVLAVAMALMLIPTMASAASDISGHWAEETLEKWSDLGWFTGDGAGAYRPNAAISRAEFMALINRMKGYTAPRTRLTKYTDVNSSAWYNDTVAIAVEKGYITGYEDGTVRPEANITRQEAIAIIARLEEVSAKDNSILNSASDGAAVAGWAKGYVAACIENGLVAGSANRINPSANITRAETVVLLDRVYSNARIYAFAGQYGPESGALEVANVTVAGSGVRLNNMKVAGDLNITKAVGEGDVWLENLDVKGILDVAGGGINSIHIKHCHIKEIIIDKDYVRIILEDKTVIEILIVGGAHDIIEILDDSEVLKATIMTTANGTEIKLEEGAVIDEITINAPTTITGEGTIKVANIKSEGVVMDKEPEKLNIDPGITITVGDEEIGGPPPAGGGGSSSSGEDKGSIKVTCAYDKTSGDLTVTLEPAATPTSLKITKQGGGNVTFTGSLPNGKVPSFVVSFANALEFGMYDVEVGFEGNLKGTGTFEVKSDGGGTVTVAGVSIIDKKTVEVTLSGNGKAITEADIKVEKSTDNGATWTELASSAGYSLTPETAGNNKVWTITLVAELADGDQIKVSDKAGGGLGVGSADDTYEAPVLPSSDKKIMTIAGQSVSIAQGGTDDAPVAHSVNVQNSKATFALADITVSNKATAYLYEEDDFETDPVTGTDKIALVAGDDVTVYIKVVAEDESEAFYAITITRLADTGVTLGTVTETVPGEAGTPGVYTLSVSAGATNDGYIAVYVNLDTEDTTVWVELVKDATPAAVASKIKTELDKVTAITNKYTVSVNTAAVALTQKTVKVITFNAANFKLTDGVTGAAAGPSVETEKAVVGTSKLGVYTLTVATGANAEGYNLVYVNIDTEEKTVLVELEEGDTTAAAVATKIKNALGGESAITAKYTIGGIGDAVTLTQITAKTVAFVANTSFSLENGFTSVDAAASDNTTPPAEGTPGTPGVYELKVTEGASANGYIKIYVNLDEENCTEWVEVADEDTKAMVAGKIKAKLDTVTEITAKYSVGVGVDGDAVTLTQINPKVISFSPANFKLSALVSGATGSTAETTAGMAGTSDVLGEYTLTVSTGATAKGFIKVFVNIDNEDETVWVEVEATDTAADAVAAKVRTELGKVTAITGKYDIGGTAATVTLTQKTVKELTFGATMFTLTDGASGAVGTSTATPAVNGTAAEFTVAVTHAATVAGTILVRVNGGGITNCDVEVIVAATDDENAVAGKIQTALAANTTINAKFDVTVATDTITFTQLAPFSDITLAVTL